MYHHYVRPHHELLHNPNMRNPTVPGTSTSNAARYKNSELMNQNGKDNSKRAYIPIFQGKTISNDRSVNATVLLDSASAVVMMSGKLVNILYIKGTPIVIGIIDVGAIATQQTTAKVEFFLEDVMGSQVLVEAIILEKAGGRAAPIPFKTEKEISNKIHVNHFYTNGSKINLLVGMNVLQLHQQISLRESRNGLAIIETRFGPLSGTIYRP